MKLPPSPPKLPIIGNLHQLGSLPHRSLQALSKIYGPLMLLKLGQSSTLVVSSTEIVREIVKVNDVVFANRPKTTAANIFLHNCTDIAFAPHDEHWRQSKKICVVELFNMKRVQSFQFIREEEVRILLDKIRHAGSGEIINLSEMLQEIANNIVSRCILGRKIEGGINGKATFGELMGRFMTQFMDFSFGDVFPSLAWMDVLTGLISRLKSTFKELDSLLDEDMFVGGNTTKTVMEWTMTELLRNENVLIKVQKEVRAVVGEKQEVNYDIPPQTKVLINVWAIHRDPRNWDRPEEFIPERFYDNPMEFKGQYGEFSPFGVGRRGCPAILFGIALIEHVLANLLHWFDWKLPDLDGGATTCQDDNLDKMISEVNGINVSKKFPLHVLPTLYSP
ncbi:hypothetical protein ACFE04_026561 [Oxalis oulophora]